MSARFSLSAIALVCALVSSAANADAPTAPVSQQEQVFEQGGWVLHSHPKQGMRLLDAQGKQRWKISSFATRFYLSQDGTYLVTMNRDENLMPLNASKEHTLFTVWKNGKQIRAYHLYDLNLTTAQLQKTASHYFWGNILELTPENFLKLELGDGRQVQISLDTLKMTPAR